MGMSAVFTEQFRLNLKAYDMHSSGGSFIEELEEVPRQLLGQKAFIWLLPLFHSWLRPNSFHASRHNNAASFDAYHAT